MKHHVFVPSENILPKKYHQEYATNALNDNTLHEPRIAPHRRKIYIISLCENQWNAWCYYFQDNKVSNKMVEQGSLKQCEIACQNDYITTKHSKLLAAC